MVNHSVRTPEDELWADMWRALDTQPMYQIRKAFRRRHCRLGPRSDGLIPWRLVREAYTDDQTVWERFVEEAERRNLGPVLELGRETTTDKEREQELQPSSDGVLYWSPDPEFPEGRLEPHSYGGDAGIDCVTAESVVLLPGSTSYIPLGVRIQPPSGYWVMIHGRSSSLAHGLQVHTGIIDNGYRGPLYAVVTNLRDSEQKVGAGTKICQLLTFPLHQPPLVQTGRLAESDRGTAGFGSTGGTIKEG